MLVGVLSDSHDHLQNLKKALEVLQSEGAELIIHAGDYVAPFSVALLAQLSLPWYGVRGNNDGEVLGIFERSSGKISSPHLKIEEKGYRIWVSHYPQPAEAAFESAHFDLVVYGHTHQAVIKENRGKLLVNPGEVCGLLSGKPTVAICDLSKGVAKLIEI